MTDSLLQQTNALPPAVPPRKRLTRHEAVMATLPPKRAEPEPAPPVRKDPTPEPAPLATWEPGLLQRFLAALVNIFRRALGLIVGVPPKAASVPSDARAHAVDQAMPRDPKDVQIEQLKAELFALKREFADAQRELARFKFAARAYGAEISAEDAEDAEEKEARAAKAVAALEEDVAAREARALALDLARDARRTAAERAAAAAEAAAAEAAAGVRRQAAMDALKSESPGVASQVGESQSDDGQAVEEVELEVQRPKG